MPSFQSSIHIIGHVGVCVEDGWLKRPHLAQSDWTLGLGEAAHLLECNKVHATQHLGGSHTPPRGLVWAP